MGFFSWTCAVSGESISNVHAGRNSHSCYLVTPDKTYYEPAYRGYGEFGGVDVYALIGDGDRSKGIRDSFDGEPKFDIKLVLESHYTGQGYDDLPASGDCPYQGYFYDYFEDEGVHKEPSDWRENRQ